MSLKSNLTLASLLLCFAAFLAFKSDDAETTLEPFSIEIIKKEKEIFMTCNSGCAWKTLSFETETKGPAWIDENGVSDLKDDVADKAYMGLTDFRFSILPTEKGVHLTGLEGTAWIDLSFTMKNYRPQLINQMGMVK